MTSHGPDSNSTKVRGERKRIFPMTIEELAGRIVDGVFGVDREVIARELWDLMDYAADEDCSRCTSDDFNQSTWSTWVDIVRAFDPELAKSAPTIPINGIVDQISEDNDSVPSELIDFEVRQLAEAANMPSVLNEKQADDLVAGWEWLQIIKERPNLFT